MDVLQLKAAALAMEESILADYRALHLHPAVAHHEQETHRYLRTRLTEMGISFLAPTDQITIAVLDSGAPGAVVGLRCDTDALPVQEETGCAFASRVPGVMHACGHDGHMAMGLAAVKILSENRDWKGKVKVIFQPAEEGENGAGEVIATGLVNDCDVFFGVHLWSAYATGHFHASASVTSAAVDMFEIRVKGKGGHGASPEKCHDAIVAAAEIVSSVQTIVSRAVSPLDPALITVGSFHAGTVGNIIAGEAVLKGTIRTLRADTRGMIQQAMKERVNTIAALHGCTGEWINRGLSGAVQNDPRATALARRCAISLMGEVREQETAMLGDDFADYGAIAPYCYLQIGIADEKKGTHYAHHNSHFAIDPAMLAPGAAWLAACAATAGTEWKKEEEQ